MRYFNFVTLVNMLESDKVKVVIPSSLNNYLCSLKLNIRHTIPLHHCQLTHPNTNNFDYNFRLSPQCHLLTVETFAFTYIIITITNFLSNNNSEFIKNFNQNAKIKLMFYRRFYFCPFLCCFAYYIAVWHAFVKFDVTH